MLQFVSKESPQYRWLIDNQSYPSLELNKVENHNAISKWIKESNMTVYVVMEGEKHLPKPRPAPPLPSKREIDDWKKRVRKIESDKPNKILHPYKHHKWQNSLEYEKTREPIDIWRYQKTFAENATERVIAWTFFFENEEDMALFKLTWG